MSRQKPRHRERGVTLIEISIAIVIAAILMGLAAPMVGGLTAASLRSSAGKLSGMIKATYDHAVLSGHTARLLIDLEKGTVTAEETADYVGLVIEDDPRRRDDDDDDKDKAEDKEQDGQLVLLSIAKRISDRPSRRHKKATFAKILGTSTMELDSDIKVTELQSEHLKTPVTKGKDAIYFFPMGYSEHALLTLEDPAGRVFSIEVEPLNGRTKIRDSKVRFEDPTK